MTDRGPSSSPAATPSTGPPSPTCSTPSPTSAGSTSQHPEALERLAPGRVGADVVLAYDLPGVRFRPRRAARAPAPAGAGSSPGMDGLLDEGQPFVFLHHAIGLVAGVAGLRRDRRWPLPLRARRRCGASAWPDSGYRHDVAQTLTVVAPDHPVCAGLPPTFELTDETYLCPVFDDDVTPLVVDRRAPHRPGPLVDHAGGDRPAGQQRRAGTTRRAARSVAWVKRSGRSPVVYLQPGDGPEAFDNPNYRRLLAQRPALGRLARGPGLGRR